MSKSNTPSDSAAESAAAPSANAGTAMSGQVVDLSVLIDLKELKSVRQTLDPHRKADRYPVQDFFDIRCELSDPSVPEEGRVWLPGMLVDISETGCACMVIAKDAARTIPHQVEKLQLRLRFRNQSFLVLDLSIKRIVTSKGVPASGAGEVGHLTYGGTLDTRDPGYAPFRDLVRFIDSLTTYQGQMALRNVPVR